MSIACFALNSSSLAHCGAAANLAVETLTECCSFEKYACVDSTDGAQQLIKSLKAKHTHVVVLAASVQDVGGRQSDTLVALKALCTEHSKFVTVLFDVSVEIQTTPTFCGVKCRQPHSEKPMFLQSINYDASCWVPDTGSFCIPLEYPLLSCGMFSAGGGVLLCTGWGVCGWLTAAADHIAQTLVGHILKETQADITTADVVSSLRLHLVHTDRSVTIEVPERLSLGVSLVQTTAVCRASLEAMQECFVQDERDSRDDASSSASSGVSRAGRFATPTLQECVATWPAVRSRPDTLQCSDTGTCDMQQCVFSTYLQVKPFTAPVFRPVQAQAGVNNLSYGDHKATTHDSDYCGFESRRDAQSYGKLAAAPHSFAAYSRAVAFVRTLQGMGTSGPAPHMTAVAVVQHREFRFYLKAASKRDNVLAFLKRKKLDVVRVWLERTRHARTPDTTDDTVDGEESGPPSECSLCSADPPASEGAELAASFVYILHVTVLPQAGGAEKVDLLRSGPDALSAPVLVLPDNFALPVFQRVSVCVGLPKAQFEYMKRLTTEGACVLSRVVKNDFEHHATTTTTTAAPQEAAAGGPFSQPLKRFLNAKRLLDRATRRTPPLDCGSSAYYFAQALTLGRGFFANLEMDLGRCDLHGVVRPVVQLVGGRCHASWVCARARSVQGSDAPPRSSATERSSPKLDLNTAFSEAAWNSRFTTPHDFPEEMQPTGRERRQQLVALYRRDADPHLAHYLRRQGRVAAVRTAPPEMEPPAFEQRYQQKILFSDSYPVYLLGGQECRTGYGSNFERQCASFGYLKAFATLREGALSQGAGAEAETAEVATPRSVLASSAVLSPKERMLLSMTSVETDGVTSPQSTALSEGEKKAAPQHDTARPQLSLRPLPSGTSTTSTLSGMMEIKKYYNAMNRNSIDFEVRDDVRQGISRRMLTPQQGSTEAQKATSETYTAQNKQVGIQKYCATLAGSRGKKSAKKSTLENFNKALGIAEGGSPFLLKHSQRQRFRFHAKGCVKKPKTASQAAPQAAPQSRQSPAQTQIFLWVFSSQQVLDIANTFHKFCNAVEKESFICKVCADAVRRVSAASVHTNSSSSDTASNSTPSTADTEYCACPDIYLQVKTIRVSCDPTSQGFKHFARLVRDMRRQTFHALLGRGSRGAVREEAEMTTDPTAFHMSAGVLQRLLQAWVGAGGEWYTVPLCMFVMLATVVTSAKNLALLTGFRSRCTRKMSKIECSNDFAEYEFFLRREAESAGSCGSVGVRWGPLLFSKCFSQFSPRLSESMLLLCALPTQAQLHLMRAGVHRFYEESGRSIRKKHIFLHPTLPTGQPIVPTEEHEPTASEADVHAGGLSRGGSEYDEERFVPEGEEGQEGQEGEGECADTADVAHQDVTMHRIHLSSEAEVEGAPQAELTPEPESHFASKAVPEHGAEIELMSPEAEVVPNIQPDTASSMQTAAAQPRTEAAVSTAQPDEDIAWGNGAEAVWGEVLAQVTDSMDPADQACP